LSIAVKKLGEEYNRYFKDYRVDFDFVGIKRRVVINGFDANEMVPIEAAPIEAAPIEAYRANDQIDDLPGSLHPTVAIETTLQERYPG